VAEAVAGFAGVASVTVVAASANANIAGKNRRRATRVAALFGANCRMFMGPPQ